MCGIAGLIVQHQSSTSPLEQGKRMMNSLTHRGPDSHGIWVNDREGLVLAHNRLAIQDLSERGHQPMWSQSGRYCIIFNGEIYNFKELARELITSGCQFSGHSDTEVLLSAVEEWGLLEAVKRSTGMFAFSLWDAKELTLSLCRDRLGEKPLYYGWVENCFCFASELKAIEAIAPQRKLDMDHQGLTNYLRYGYISAPHSIYRGIYKLVPGTIFTCPIRKILDLPQYSPFADSSTPGPKTYWSVRDAADYGLNNLISSEEEA
jgi:asparagine synthase (glutamine-hydrolysing)